MGMSTFSQSFILFSGRKTKTLILRRSIRYISSRHNGTSFASLGLRPPVVNALQAAFPNVKEPTNVQAQYIPAVLNGQDLLLKDSTGSGK